MTDKKQLAEIVREAKEKYIYSDEIAQYLIDHGVVVPVMCKDCVHSRPIDYTKSPEKYFFGDFRVCECFAVVGDEPMIYSTIHFCSYGERKEVDNG